MIVLFSFPHLILDFPFPSLTWSWLSQCCGSGSEYGSGSISQSHGSADPDPAPHQNVLDPQHWIVPSPFPSWSLIVPFSFLNWSLIVPFPSVHLKLFVSSPFLAWSLTVSFPSLPWSLLSSILSSTEAWLWLFLPSPEAWLSLFLLLTFVWLSPLPRSPERHPATWDTRHSRAFLYLFAHWNQGAGGAHTFHTEQNITSTVDIEQYRRGGKERLKDFVMRIFWLFYIYSMSRSTYRSSSRSLLEFFIFKRLLDLFSGSNIFLVLIATAWHSFSQFLSVASYLWVWETFLPLERFYWLENLHFESQGAEKNVLYCIMLSSAWQPSQETHLFL